MKKKYLECKMDIVSLNGADIITTSDGKSLSDSQIQENDGTIGGGL